MPAALPAEPPPVAVMVPPVMWIPSTLPPSEPPMPAPPLLPPVAVMVPPEM